MINVLTKNISPGTLSEGPFWNKLKQELGWVDISQKKVHFMSTDSGKHRCLQLAEMVGGVVLSEGARLLAATESGIYWLNPETNKLDQIADPESGQPGNRFNDVKCDRRGRFWVGSMNMLGSDPTGALYRLDKRGQVYQAVKGLTISNGIGWSPDDKIIYYTDSAAGIIYCADYNLDSGVISKSREFVCVPETDGCPDGLTVDAEGGVWSAHWDGWRVTRYMPNGCIDHVIELPVPRVTSCCFGGSVLDTLYITSAAEGLSVEQLQTAPLSGHVFTVKVSVKGIEETPYAGDFTK